MAITWVDMASPFDGQDFRRWDDNGAYRLDIYKEDCGAVLSGTGETGTDADNLTDVRVWYNLRAANDYAIDDINWPTDIGLVLRYNSAGPRFYAAFFRARNINSTAYNKFLRAGHCSIYKYDGGWTVIGGGSGDPSLGTPPGPVSLGFSIEGTDLQFWGSSGEGPPWTGTLLVSASDASLASGSVGIIRGSLSFPRDWMLLDDFTVEELT